jgi:uncharacterized membrane protein
MLLLFILAIFLLLFFFILLQLHILTFAFEKLGFSAFAVFLILMGSLVGSVINIPIKEIPNETTFKESVSFYGIRYRIPRYQSNSTQLSINVGGALIPSFVSVYLWMNGGNLVTPIIATAIVAFIVNRVARPVPGLGIATPLFIPPLAALLVAFILASGDAPRIAYISGTMGTLLGADLLNLNKIKDLGAPVASIGGAGTFDGIFITGIIAVLFA